MPRKKEDTVPEGSVRVRITRFGAGKVSSGEHVSGEGDIMLEADETVPVAESIANELQDRGFAEIVADG